MGNESPSFVAEGISYPRPADETSTIMIIIQLAPDRGITTLERAKKEESNFLA